MTQALRRYKRPRRLLAVLAILGALALTLGMVIRPVRADAATHSCSVSSLRGDYAGNLSGTSASTGPLALQALTTFNGDGTATASVTLMTQTSGPIQFTSMITYTLDSNCTGTLTSVRSTGQTAHYVIAVTDKAFHVHLLQTDAGSVVSGTVERV
jgi:hypothetical protein